MRRLLCTLSLVATSLYITGCGFTVDKVANISTGGTGTHGTVHGGQAPVVGALVSVYAIGNPGAPTLLASTTSDSNGNFAFGGVGTSYTCGSLLAKGSPVSPQQAPTPHPHSNNQDSSAQVRAIGGSTGALHARPAALPSPTQTYVYITAVGGDAGGGPNSSIALGAGLGKCIDAQSETVQINEVSTVVLANVVGNFVHGGTIQIGTFSNDPHQLNALEIGLTNTFQTIDDLPTGTVNPNTVSTSGGTSITIDAAKIYSIANTIASCVNSADVVLPTPGPSAACQTLFTDANYFGEDSYDTFTAALYMAFQPTQDVIPLYQLASATPPFVGLAAAPNDWSVGVSYSTSAMGLAIYQSVIGGGSSSTIDLDSNSRVWFPSNKSGAVGIAYFDPTENTFNGPFGADATFPITLPQYVALDDPDQVAWVTDTKTAALVGVSTAPGSEGDILASTNFVDPYGGTNTVANGPLLVNSDESVVINYDDSQSVPLQITYDPFGNLVIGQSAFTLQPTGLTINTTQGSATNDPTQPVVIAASSDLSSACNLEYSSKNDGNFVFVQDTTCTLSGGIATGAYNSANQVQDQVAAFSDSDSFCSEILGACSSIPELLSFPEGVAVDGGDQVWFANLGNASIFQLALSYKSGGSPTYSTVSDRALLHGSGNGGTMISPMGIAIDRGGNIWVSNTSCASTGDTSCIFTLSEVFAVAYPTFTPLSLQAARLQGTVPPSGSTEGTGTPHPMLHRMPVARASVLQK